MDTGKRSKVRDGVFFRTAYNYDTDAASVASGLACDDPSLTKQSFKDECDINVIVKRFGITGQLPQNVRMPMVGDFTAVGDYRDALDALMMAEDSFSRLPADVRAEFDNDPDAFVNFCSDPCNKARAAELGLLSPAAYKAHQEAQALLATPTPKDPTSVVPKAS